MFTIEAGVPAGLVAAARIRAQKNVPFRVMSTTVRQAFGDMSPAGTGKLAAALLISTPGRPYASSAARRTRRRSPRGRGCRRRPSSPAPPAR